MRSLRYFYLMQIGDVEVPSSVSGQPHPSPHPWMTHFRCWSWLSIMAWPSRSLQASSGKPCPLRVVGCPPSHAHGSFRNGSLCLGRTGRGPMTPPMSDGTQGRWPGPEGRGELAREAMALLRPQLPCPLPEAAWHSGLVGAWNFQPCWWRQKAATPRTTRQSPSLSLLVHLLSTQGPGQVPALG